MDDKVFASARMTVALDEDQVAYDAIPAVNIFDGDPNRSRRINATVRGASLPRWRRNRWLVVTPLLAAAGLLLMGCQGGY